LESLQARPRIPTQGSQGPRVHARPNADDFDGNGTGGPGRPSRMEETPFSLLSGLYLQVLLY